MSIIKTLLHHYGCFILALTFICALIMYLIIRQFLSKKPQNSDKPLPYQSIPYKASHDISNLFDLLPKLDLRDAALRLSNESLRIFPNEAHMEYHHHEARDGTEGDYEKVLERAKMELEIQWPDFYTLWQLLIARVDSGESYDKSDNPSYERPESFLRNVEYELVKHCPDRYRHYIADEQKRLLKR